MSERQTFLYGWIGPADAMQHLGIHSRSALYRLINDWHLPFQRIGARYYRFRRADLDEWMEQQGAPALAHVKRTA